MLVWSQHAERILKVSTSDAVGEDLFSLGSRLSSPEFERDFTAAEARGKPHASREVEGRGQPDSLSRDVLAVLRSNGQAKGTLLLVERAARSQVASG